MDIHIHAYTNIYICIHTSNQLIYIYIYSTHIPMKNGDFSWDAGVVKIVKLVAFGMIIPTATAATDLDVSDAQLHGAEDA